VTVPDRSGAAPTGTGTGVPQTLRFTARTVDGQPFDAAALAGRPTVLWFWAAWCPRCRAAADDVAAVHRDNARVNVVGVAGLRSGDNKMREFVRDQGIGGFPNLADDAGEVWRRFSVTTQEYFVLLDRAGNVVHSGPLSADDLRQRVAALG
jgi:peroxiredoxin